MISHVLNKIKTDHVNKDEFLEKIKTTKEEIKNYLSQNQLVDLPEYNLAITDMPIEFQGLNRIRLVQPGVYESTDSYTLQIAEFNKDLSEEQIQSLLEEYNNFFLPFYTVREIYPGQFVPFFFANKNSSLLRKLYPNFPLIKGWPIFIDELLVKSGYGNYDLRRRLNELKFRLKIVMDFVLDLNIHQGSMTKEDAMAYMTRQGFQSEIEAENNWNRISMNPLELAYAYVGFQEMLDMEKAYRKKVGNSFTYRDFLNKLLSYGTLPIRHLKKKMNE